MEQLIELEYREIQENKVYEDIIKRVVRTCYEEEKMENANLTISIILTTPRIIKEINSEFRNIEKETDVLSFPMFEKEELDNLITKSNNIPEVLGDIVISVEKVKEQAEEYGHSFERELAYMVVHGFYHLMGYDHIEEQDKIIMRPKEEKILELKCMSETDRIHQYFSEYIKCIDTRDYETAYGYLYPEFKQNYFPDQASFETYINGYYPMFMGIQYEDIERQGAYYILNVLVYDAIEREQVEYKEQSFIIYELDFGEFVLSFQV